MKAKLLVFFGIVVTGIIISVFTLTKCEGKKDDPGNLAVTGEGGTGKSSAAATNSKAEPTPSGEKGESGKASTMANSSTPKPAGSSTASQKGTPGMTANAASSGAEPPSPEEKKFPSNSKSVEGVVGTMANSVLKKDFNAFMQAAASVSASPPGAQSGIAAAPGSPEADIAALAAVDHTVPSELREKLKTIIEDPNLKLDPERPFWEVAKDRNTFRWILNFIPVKKGRGEPKSIMVDIEKISGTDFKVTKVGFPPTMQQVVTSMNSPAAPQSDGPSVDIDTLSISKAFSDAVLSEDFVSARKLTSAEVTDERIAGLMIALEEGDFKLRQDRPLMVTYSRDDLALVLSRVDSAQESSEFALELTRSSPKEPWKIRDLTFGKVIAALAKKADGPYSPIVEDPSGGESLVIYFDFDEAGLTSRADSQLKIVANILNQDITRKIRITGHADALGTDEYNRELSQRRAESIRNAIISRGANPAQVITEGYGETRPRKPNFLDDGSDNPTGRSLNRRAEVYLDF